MNHIFDRDKMNSIFLLIQAVAVLVGLVAKLDSFVVITMEITRDSTVTVGLVLK